MPFFTAWSKRRQRLGQAYYRRRHRRNPWPHLIGPQVTELLPELTLAANAELTIEEIARNVHAHPSLSEALMEAAHGLAGGYIHA